MDSINKFKLDCLMAYMVGVEQNKKPRFTSSMTTGTKILNPNTIIKINRLPKKRVFKEKNT